MSQGAPPPIFRPHLWLLPGLATAAALIVSWSLLPHARTLWQGDPLRPPHLVELETEQQVRLLSGQTTLQLPLLLPCQGSAAFDGTIDGGAPFSVKSDGRTVAVAMPAPLSAGPHRLLLSARGCRGDSGPRHSHVQLLQLPAVVPVPRLQVARGSEAGGLSAAVRGTPGAEAEILLLPESGPGAEGALPVAVALQLSAGGAASVDLPYPLERAHLLRARQRVPLALDGRAVPSALSGPPTMVTRAQLLTQSPSTAALFARLVVGARELRFGWDLTLPDSYLSVGASAPRGRLDGAPPVLLRVGQSAGPLASGFDCSLRDATVERLPGAMRYRGQCRLTSGETMRTLLFQTGAPVHLLVSDDPALHLPAILEVAPGAGARLAAADPPPRPGGRFLLDNGEPGPYLRFVRRTVFPLVDMPEPAALLLHPARRIAEHAQELIALVLRLLPLMLLLPLLTERRLSAMVLCLLIGGAFSPLVWAGLLLQNAAVSRDARQLLSAALWEIAALCWAIAAVRSRGLLGSLPKQILLLLFLALPLVWIYALGAFGPFGAVAERGGAISVTLGAGLALLVLLALSRLLQLSGLALRFQVALLCMGVLVLVMHGLRPGEFYVDVVARRLSHLSAALAVLTAAVIGRRRPEVLPALHFPLFLAVVPPLYLDHGLPLGLLTGLLVYRLWRTFFAPPEAAVFVQAEAADKVPAEVESVLVAIGEHPLLQVHEEKEALEVRMRRGEVAPDAYQLARESLLSREEQMVRAGYDPAYRSLPNVLASGTEAGPIADGARALKLMLPPMVLYLLFLLLVKEPFDPVRLLGQLLGSLRQVIQIGAMCFFFGFAFASLPGKNGLIKALFVTLLTVACELPAAVLTWYRPEDIGRGLVRWVGVLGILGWVGLGGFDLERLRRARRGIFDLARVRGYSRGFALTTSLILAIFTAIMSGVTGRVGALLTTAVVSPEGAAATALPPGEPAAYGQQVMAVDEALQ